MSSSSSDPPVEDPAPIMLKMLSIISRCIDEALWQLTSRQNFDEDPEVGPKIFDMVALGCRLLTSDGAGVKLSDDKLMKSFNEYRAYVTEKLGEFAKGYLACKQWDPMPEPVLDLKSKPEASAAAGSAGDAEGVSVASFRHLSAEDAMKFLAFCRAVFPDKTSIGQAQVQSLKFAKDAETQLLAWKLTQHQSEDFVIQPGQLVDQLCAAVSARVNPDWVVEATLLYSDKASAGHNTFFKSIGYLRSFLHLRTHLILWLLKGSACWLTVDHDFPRNEIDPQVAQQLAAADSLIGNFEDLRAFWTGFVHFCLDFAAKSSVPDVAEKPSFSDEFPEWLLDVQELIGTDIVGAVSTGEGLPDAPDATLINYALRIKGRLSTNRRFSTSE